MISQELYKQLEMIIQQKDINLYDVEFLKENDSLILRVSLYKKGGVSLEDCELVSHLISPLLDVELEELNAYHLEVSSPGIERVLKKPQHFACSIGESVEVRLQDKTVVRGILECYNEISIQIKEIPETTKQKSSNKQDNTRESKIHTLDLANCKKIKTVFNWNSYSLQV